MDGDRGENERAGQVLPTPRPGPDQRRIVREPATMAKPSQYSPHGVIHNPEHFAHTVGSGPWKRAVHDALRDGYGVEDIALRLGCRLDAVREYVAKLRRLGRLVAVLKEGKG